MRDVGPPLRAALTGMKQSPSIVDIMVVLGDLKLAMNPDRLQIIVIYVNF